MKLPSLTRKKQTLKRKLLGYFILLAVLLLILLYIGMFMIGGYTATKKRVSNTLSFQADVFERQIDTYYDNLAVMSVQLSQATTAIIEAYLEEEQIAFTALNGSSQHIENIQEKMIEALKHKLWEADCTGAFIMLDAQVNTTVADAQHSRTGLYLQRNSLETSDTRMLLYRGLSNVGKQHNCMPHRKWRLEFTTTLFPNYTQLKEQASLPLHSCYRITDVVKLPGTDQHVMLMTVPLLSQDGSFYGLCGFEINEGYFKQTFAQPSELNRAIFCLSKGKNGLHFAEESLSSGVLNEYYLEPSGSFEAESMGKGLTRYIGKNATYVGITEPIQLCPGENTSSISVLITERDYFNMKRSDSLRAALLILCFSAVAVSLAMFFTRRYLTPLKKNLENIRQKEYEEDSAYVSEISDLFAFLAEQDRQNESALTQAQQEKADALTAVAQIQGQYDEASKQAQRLAYSRKTEIDPYDFENFKAGLQTLTDKERQIFELYLSGKTAKEIAPLVNIQESTLKFHNHNMLGKLGVSSRKQMLRFAALMKQEEDSK